MEGEESDSEDDNTYSLLVVEDPETALEVMRDGFGDYDVVFIESSLLHGAKALVAYIDEHPAGAIVGFRVGEIGVIYYLYVLDEYRGLGLGKTLVLSMEELLEESGARVFIASTSSWNNSSKSLFEKLSYDIVMIPVFMAKSRGLGDKAVKIACMDDDDVIMVKPSLGSLIDALSRIESRDTMKIWVSTCYEPWLRYVRRKPVKTSKTHSLSLKRWSVPKR